ncbi:MAG: MFS transporter [Pikeienuella sp.]
MRTIISFAALFLSAAFVQLSSGALSPLDALAGSALGFSARDIGLMGSTHFLGFFLGCWLTPRLMGAIGHSRAFAAMAAIGAIGALLHPVFYDPLAWAALRVLTGITVAGCYSVIESWMQAKVDNANRGRVVSIYRIVDMAASVAAQGVVAVLDPTSYIAYNIIAVICCLCLLPLTMTTAKPPPSPVSPRLRPLMVFQRSPLAAFSVLIVGLTNSSFRMVGPVYAIESGLNATGVALFMAAGVGGGALSQWPAGWLSDKYDRRWVLIWISLLSMAVSAVISLSGTVTGVWVYVAAFSFGAAIFPLFSIAAAHANDFAKPEEMVELNTGLMFLYGVGAIISPIAAASLIESYGPSALFIYISAAHLALILFGLWRMRRRPVATAKTEHKYVPRTSFLFTRIFKSRNM